MVSTTNVVALCVIIFSLVLVEKQRLSFDKDRWTSDAERLAGTKNELTVGVLTMLIVLLKW